MEASILNTLGTTTEMVGTLADGHVFSCLCIVLLRVCVSVCAYVCVLREIALLWLPLLERTLVMLD